MSNEKTLQGWVPDVADREALFHALNEAFDYRGDVAITRRNGDVVEGYLFDRRTGEGLDDSTIRMFPKDRDERIEIPYADVARLEFTGKDTAHGRSFEKWIQRYVEKKMKGEKANIDE